MICPPRVPRRQAAVLLLLAGCAPGLPSPGGAPATAPASHEPWRPPPPPAPPPARPAPAGPGAPAQPAAAPSPSAVPADLAERIQRLTVGDVVDLALRNNPATAQSWANARAAAAAYGAARGEYYPTLDASMAVNRIKTIATAGRVAVQQTTWGPSATLTWLLLDFGGRGGAIEGARQALLAADWNHNASIASVVLGAQVAYYNYVATRALVDAQRASVKDAQANLDAAEARRRAGVATLADVLQARTALAQAQLALDTTEGTRQTTRGQLALALGFPANLPYDVDSVPPSLPIGPVADSVEALIERAVRDRPDLAAVRAQAAQASARIRELRGARLPPLQVSGTGGYNYVAGRAGGGNNYNVGVALSIPLFNGFAREYQQEQAEQLADAAAAQARSLEQQVTFQVFNSYYGLQTATKRVQTSNTLLASAQQSLDVAQARYKAGVGTVLDLLAAQSALADARSQAIQARLSWYTSLAQLAHDAGALDARGATNLRMSPDTVESRPPQ
ncbi:MAG TPA: TolC family protein [Gemmatimonadales bacterium]|nr:TolC family protein [Gemmatimonadales bacterium]